VSGRVGVAVRLSFSEVAVFEYVNLGAGDTTAVDCLDLQAGAKVECCGGVAQHMERNACVDERPEEHVSRDTGKAVEISDAHNA